jgi:hypothetical protein
MSTCKGNTGKCKNDNMQYRRNDTRIERGNDRERKGAIGSGVDEEYASIVEPGATLATAEDWGTSATDI